MKLSRKEFQIRIIKILDEMEIKNKDIDVLDFISNVFKDFPLDSNDKKIFDIFKNSKQLALNFSNPDTLKNISSMMPQNFEEIEKLFKKLFEAQFDSSMMNPKKDDEEDEDDDESKVN